VIWLYVGLGVVAAVVVTVVVVGSLLPRGHRVARAVQLSAPPETVWQLVTDFRNLSSWHPHVLKVEQLADQDGREVWRETYKGNMALALQTREAVRPRRLVRTIVGDDQPFTGRWEFALEPANGGTRLTIEEVGEVPNPVFRFVARVFMNPATHLETYLKALAAKVGGPAAVESPVLS
jgi:uncharacterized protein YndB with AHSA1/START domain